MPFGFVRSFRMARLTTFSDVAQASGLPYRRRLACFFGMRAHQAKPSFLGIWSLVLGHSVVVWIFAYLGIFFRVCAPLLLAALPLGTREAVIQTREGHSYSGQVALRDGQIVILNAAQNLLVGLPTTNVLWAAFEKDSTFDAFMPTRGDPDSFWNSEDFGWSAAPAHFSFQSRVGRVACTGTNIGGAKDSFHFIFQRFRGDREVVVRMLHVPSGGEYAKAGLMVREDLTPESRNVFLSLGPKIGGAMQVREEFGAETLEAARPDLFIPQWIKIKRQGNHFALFKSGTGHRWTLLQELDLPMRDEVYAGVAVTGLNVWPVGADTASHASFDNLQIGTSLPRNSYVPVVHLRSGSTICARIQSATAEQIQFSGPLPDAPLATAPVSRIVFQWVPYRFSSILNQGRPGVLLTSGEFIEGTFKGIRDDRVTMSSVPLGLRSFDLNTEVYALVLAPMSRQPYAFEVITEDNSKWLATQLEIGKSELLVQDSALGTRRIPIYELAEIRSARSAPLPSTLALRQASR